MQPCPHGHDQPLLCQILPLQRRQHILINRVFRDDMVDGDDFLLSLPPQSGVRLLVELEASCQPEPDQDVSARLDVKAVSG